MLSALLALSLSVADPLGFPPVAATLASMGAATPPLTLPASPGLGLGNLALPGVALALLAVVTLLMKRRTAQVGRHVRVLETTSLGPKRALVVARLGDELLVIGSSEAGLQLLAARPAGDGPPEAARLRAVPDLATAPAGPAPRQGPLAAMLGRLRGARPEASRPAAEEAAPAGLPAFDALLAESAEDQELRRKLARGQSGSIR
jgi:flagellar biogenesis protein FliO